MKLYELKFTVRLGEHTFRFTNLFEAKDDKDADRLAHLWCKDFYGSTGEQEEEDYYTFHAGCIGLKIDSVKHVSNRQKWKNEQYHSAMIRPEL